MKKYLYPLLFICAFSVSCRKDPTGGNPPCAVVLSVAGTAVPLAGSAYDDTNNVLVLCDSGKKKLINLNTKTLSYYSETCKTPLFNLEISGVCYKNTPGR